MPRDNRSSDRRCLIVERHEWETGFSQKQLQLPLEEAERFFGPADQTRSIRVRIGGAGPREYPCSISRRYANGTRRVNGLDLVGLLGSCFVFFQETDDPDLYEFWCQYDKPIVVARYSEWTQARNSQYGHKQLVNTVLAPVDRPIVRFDN